MTSTAFDITLQSATFTVSAKRGLRGWAYEVRTAGPLGLLVPQAWLQAGDVAKIEARLAEVV
jgi:hypothetical protein